MRGGAGLDFFDNGRKDDLQPDEQETIIAEIREQRRSWLRHHMTAIYIIAGLVVVGLAFLGIKLYHDSQNPVNRFISASGKDLGTSFDFHITAEKNGEPVMAYDGTAAFEPSDHSLSVVYDAVYSDYSYANVIYTDDEDTYKGNLYQNQWVVTDVTVRAQEFFDFYTDYRHGSFDSGSFLRFTGLNTLLYAKELDDFMDTVKGRFSGDSSVARITTVSTENGTDFHYTVNVAELFGLIRDKGAPIFLTSVDYNRFVSRLNANRGSLAKAACSLDFTIDSSGYLSALTLSLNTGADVYTVSAVMSRFGSAQPVIPEEFYEAASLELPEK